MNGSLVAFALVGCINRFAGGAGGSACISEAPRCRPERGLPGRSVDLGAQSTQPCLALASAPRNTRRPACDDPALGADGNRCTTRRSHTHNTDIRELLYQWHPWYGRRIRVLAICDRPGGTICRCVPEDVDDGRSLELPSWMFDRATCQDARFTEKPQVEVAALLALRNPPSGREPASPVRCVSAPALTGAMKRYPRRGMASMKRGFLGSSPSALRTSSTWCFRTLRLYPWLICLRPRADSLRVAALCSTH